MIQVTDWNAKEVLVIKYMTWSRSLAGQFLVFQLLVVIVVLVAIAVVSVTQSTREFREVRGQRMIAVAENLASTPIVRDRFADPAAAQVLAPETDRAVALSGAGMAEILGPDGTIRVSSDPSRIRARMDLGPSRADEGRVMVRRRRHRRCAQPRRSGSDPFGERRRARRRIGQ